MWGLSKSKNTNKENSVRKDNPVIDSSNEMHEIGFENVAPLLENRGVKNLVEEGDNEIYKEGGENGDMGNYILNTGRYDKILLVTEDSKLIIRTKELLGEDNVIHIDNIDNLILEMEKAFNEIVVIFSNKLPVDIEREMDLLVNFLGNAEGISFIEINTEGYFSNSVRINSIEEINVRNGDLVEKEYIESEGTMIVREERDESSEEDQLYYQKLVLEKSAEIEDLENTIRKLQEELNKQEEFIKISLEKNENNEERDLNNESEIRKLTVTIGNLKKDLDEKRGEVTNLEINVEAQKELLRSKTKELQDLKQYLEEVEIDKKELEDALIKLKEEQIAPEIVDKLKHDIDQYEVEINSLNEQIKRLRIDAQKEIEERNLVESELRELQNSYKELLESDGKSTLILDELMLMDVSAQVYYFKVINQPPYFKSFMDNFMEIISKGKKSLMVIIREEDDYYDMYYKGIKKVNTLDELTGDEKVVCLKPSRMMFVKEEEFYNRYDSIVFIDYIRTKKRCVRGDNIVTIHAFLDERERELLGVRGYLLYAGENSIVDLRYDIKFESAKSAFIRKKYIQSKIMKWLTSVGLI